MISAILLAAGESRRMGQTKQLLEWGGKTLLQRVLDNLLRSQLDEVILVLGHEADRIRQKIDTRKVKVVINRNYREGMITSLQQGLMTLREGVEAFFIVLADQPGIGPEVFDRLISEFKRVTPQKNIVLPTYRGRRGHPALFSVKYRKEAFHLKGDVGFRQVLQEHPEDILAVEMDTDSTLQDIDTPDDFRRQVEIELAGERPLTLAGALAIRESEVISLAGGGGKTTLLFALGRELSSRKEGVVLTTTTKIWEPAPSSDFALFISDQISEVEKWILKNLGASPYLLIAAARLANGKLQGIAPSWVEKIHSLPGVSVIIVEADGAAGRSLKAPRAGEPVWPPNTTLVVPVVGIDVLGRPLDEEHVFRSEIASRVLNLPRGTAVTPEMIAGLLSEILKGSPEEARVIPFINKIDLPDGLEKGRELAKVLFSIPQARRERVILGQAHHSPVVKEIVWPSPG